MEYRYAEGKVTVTDGDGNLVVSRTVATKTEANKLIRDAVVNGIEIVGDSKPKGKK